MLVTGMKSRLWWVEEKVGSEEVETICIDVSFWKSGCEGKA